MLRKLLPNFCFLLATLLIFVAGCAKMPKVVEQPKLVAQPVRSKLPDQRGDLVVTSDPNRAKVYIDDKLIDTTPLALKDIPVGSYRVKMELEGYEIWRDNVDVKHQQMAEVYTELEPKPGTLEVRSEPNGAKVQLNEEDAGVTPWSRWVSPGEVHSVAVSAEGYYPKSRMVTVQPGGKKVVSIVLKEIPKGTLEVKSEPSGAKVWVDWKEVGITPYSGLIVVNEEHTVIVSKEGYNFKRQKVAVQQEEKKVISITLEKSLGLPTTIIGKDGAEMVLIPAGDFIMGSPEGEGEDNEHPQHTVFLDAFYIAAYEVTNAQFKKFIEANPQWRKDTIEGKYHDGNYLKDWDHTNYPSGKANHPIAYVSWYAAAAYAQWVGGKLPTEAQWEKAARGGLVGKQYPWGDELSHDDANYMGTGGRDQWSRTSSPVGSFPPNGYGLYDMAGNVWEWCTDEYDSGYYESSPKNNPTGPKTTITFVDDNFTNVHPPRVLRGGAWSDSRTDALRCAFRHRSAPAYITHFGLGYVGFRCVVAHVED